MKNLGKIGLYAVSALGIIALLWTLFTRSTVEDDSTRTSENMGKLGIDFFLIVGIIAVIVTAVLFLLYKVKDLMVHPKHGKELGIIGGIIVIALIIGAVIGGFGGLIETAIGSFIALLVLSFGFLIFDTVRSIIK